MKIEARPYQRKAIDAMRAEIRAEQRPICALPTGTGKTITALILARELGVKRLLWLAHRDELIQQPIEAARQVVPDKTLGIVKAGRHQVSCDWVFASVQTAHRDKRLASLREHRWDLIVIDEAHHATATTYRKIVDAFAGVPLAGLTATPERTDNAALGDVFDVIAYQMDLIQAVKQGHLVPPRIATHRIDVDLDAVKTRMGDFAAGALEHELLAHGIVDSVAEAWRTHCRNRKTIIFCVGVEQATRVAEAVGGAVVSGETPEGERKQILKNFTVGKVHTIANCAVLTEGFDEPSVTAIVMARPTKSKPLYIQCIGRGLRDFPGKDDCIIVDMVGASEKHTLMQAPVLFGEMIDDVPRSTGEADEFFADEMSAKFWLDRYEAQIKGLVRERRGHLKWVETSDGLALDVGAAGLLIATHGDEWSLTAIVDGVRQPLTNGEVGLEMIQGIAEDFVRRAKASGLANGGTQWRSQPITAKQLQLITKHSLGNALTRGEASDLLTAHSAGAWYNAPATGKQLWALRQRGVRYPEGITKGGASRLLGYRR